MPVQTILLVEDDADARRSLGLALADQGYRVLAAGTGRDGLREMGRGPDVVLLDLVLPDMDGLEVLDTIRAASDVPLIIVSGRTDDQHIVTGLRRGADDYVTKPVTAPVLTARLEALLRRAEPGQGGPGEPDLRFGDVELHPGRQAASKAGVDLPLTRTEFRLLCELAAHPGEAVTRERLLLRVWGYDYFGDTRLLDVHIRRLRIKIEADPGAPRLIRTVRGVGYLLTR